jgi:hypothetical protein
MPRYLDVHDFYEQVEPSLRPLAYAIRDTFVVADPQLRECLKYNTPFFERKSWVAYVGKVRKNVGIEVCFPRGLSISNEHGLLQLKDRRAIMGILFSSLQDFQDKGEVFSEIVQEALLLDEISPRSAAADLLGGHLKEPK